MRPQPHRSAFAYLLALLLIGFAGGLAACAPDPAGELAHFAPDLPQRWIEALTARDASTFEEFAREEGAGYLLLVETHLENQLDTRSPEAFENSYHLLVPALTRVRQVLAREFGFELAWSAHQRFVELPMEEAFTCVRLFDDAYAITNDAELDPSQKIRGIRTILAELDHIDAPITTSHLLLTVAEYQGALGEQEAQRRSLEECIATDSRTGTHRITCQALGVLGVLVGSQGDEEGMLRCWNEGLALAKKHRMPEQAGRLTTFFANHYNQEGRLALARELRREANELYQSYGGAPAGVRFLEDWLTLNAEMGCWDVVRRDLRGAELLLAKNASWTGEAYVRDRVARMDHIRARAMMAEGHVAEASSILRGVEAELMDLQNYSTLSRIQLSWAQGLLEADNAREALEVTERGLLVVQETGIHASLLAEAAKAEAMMGDWSACEERLQAFVDLMEDDRGQLFAEWTLHDALRIRLAHELGDIDATIDATELACTELELQLRSRDAVSEAYLALREVQVLRDVLHELLSGRPRLGYELESEWRRVPRLLGASASSRTEFSWPCGSPLQHCVELVRQALTPNGARVAKDSLNEASPRRTELPAGESPRVRYRVGRRSLDRWCIVGGKLSYASLDLSEAQLRERVGSILQQVGEEPPPTADRTATELPEGLRAELYSLARDLLPDWMFENPASTHFASTRTPDPETFPEILICPDGALSALPFGILNLSADGYVPLIARHDPVYRWAAGGDECPTKDPGNASPGVIVAAPLPVAGSALWNSNLPRLEYGLTEARALQQWMPRSILLEGEAATKSALFAAWEGAPFLYFACHVVRDADAPYISYLPLSLPPTSAEVEGSVGDGYLDARDVGAVTFRSRPLVVLSACSSGAPYLVRGAQAPGLGEAFLKAGASTVIQTYWSVRDDVEARLMQEAMHAWAVEGTPPARALNAARRDMARNGAFTHPYYWGNAVVVTAATP